VDELDLLLDELGPLTDDDMHLLVEVWDEQDDSTRRRAWTRAKAEIERRGMERRLEQVRHEVGRWAAAGRSDYHGIGGLLGMPADQARLRTLAAPALLDAAVAILTGSALPYDEHDVLMRPWQALNEQADESVAEDDSFTDGGPGTEGDSGTTG
jgi:hypothetical protein